ncbi:polyphosphate--nucleotide phosphotransferase [Verminephrobacter aporrectodeae subsp. tuberculatae]|uniref:PPK2 family polyphosphate kinase n=1 Tax=Verminephrobacter aporrectodeae TaxID=1110389 RepID=UPI002238FD9E|nr:PPK2 family polyphosphate kinase [Verminephrobacter aporrectodeae]MCW5223467.1 polyphosphate--nucleotide phosphotransferase [Verminephrobacter aporrectodeae subsp. tuberculatae]MCW5288931.1 polyphosphate--nucleotide phosphotransferase [Verminephrobacter aporrectodeae subsp. tuberculatae]
MPQTPTPPPYAAYFSARDKTLAQRWARCQPAAAQGRAFTLDAVDPDAKPFSLGDKAEDKAAVEALAMEIDTLQNLFYADKRYKLLVLLQGTDTAGKDGTIRSVFGRTSALGVHAVGWKVPSETEQAHDFLWRIHQQVPQAGDITVFNRSHYEDVLVPVVNGSITPQQHQQRLAHINGFERLLSETGTVVLKFLLHVSPEEQRARLQERLDDPAKRWKFSLGDIEVRRQWADYQRAYDQLLAATHTPWAPWTIVPANSKTHRNLMVATLLREVLRNLDLRYPGGDPQLKHLTVA